MTPRTYEYYRAAFAGHVMPFGFVDLDLFDDNVRSVTARAGSLRIRIASKSVRCVELIERILAADSLYQGIQAYSVREAVFLSRQGLDDIVVAYPAYHEVEESGLADELRRGRSIVLMIDCVEHVQALGRYGRQYDVVVPVCMDIDMSSRFPGVYFGVLRSPVQTVEQALSIARAISAEKHVALVGVMGYEAQIAGLPDAIPGKALMNRLIKTMKRRSWAEVRERRKRIVSALRTNGHELRFVNGGGTGSIEHTREDDSVTEVTVGSAFFAPALFDHYAAFRHMPAAGFAIEIVRIPRHGVFTCAGGGYVASGTGANKLPSPYLPVGARLDPREGAGEVQTPIHYNSDLRLRIGDPIFMRYAKAGEMCERFNLLLCVQDGAVTFETPTYRGEGQVFL